MPHLFRTSDGKQGKPSEPPPLTLCDRSKVEGIWAGSAKENLERWLRQPGNELAQTAEVSEVAARADDTGETIWGAAPKGARLLFVVLAPEPGKNYRLAKMITTAPTPAQAVYFRHPRFALFGILKPNGTIEKIPPLQPPPPAAPIQRDLF